jgi:hypothetical protein
MDLLLLRLLLLRVGWLALLLLRDGGSAAEGERLARRGLHALLLLCLGLGLGAHRCCCRGAAAALPPGTLSSRLALASRRLHGDTAFARYCLCVKRACRISRALHVCCALILYAWAAQSAVWRMLPPQTLIPMHGLIAAATLHGQSRDLSLYSMDAGSA